MINLINQTWNRHDKIHKTCNTLNNIVTEFRKKPPCKDAQQLINLEQLGIAGSEEANWTIKILVLL